MILPTGATVAFADGETVGLFHNTGVKPWVHLMEITAAPPAPVYSGSGALLHRICQPPWQAARRGGFAAATAAFLSKLSPDGTTEHLSLSATPGPRGDAQALPQRCEGG